MAAQDLSQADVAYLVDMHHGFEGIPSSLHAKLCHKLVNGILDGGEAFFQAYGDTDSSDDDGDGEGEEASPAVTTTHTLAVAALTPLDDVWLCEHVVTFGKQRRDLERAIDQDESSKAIAAAVAGIDSTEGTATVADSLLTGHHCHIMPGTHCGSKTPADQATAPNLPEHYILEGWGDTLLGATASCWAPQLVYDEEKCISRPEIAVQEVEEEAESFTHTQRPFFSPLHGRRFTAFWANRAVPEGGRCTAFDGHAGAYLSLSVASLCVHLKAVASLRFANLFKLSDQYIERGLCVTSGLPLQASPDQQQQQQQQHPALRDVSPDQCHPLYDWDAFLLPDELEYLRGLIYSATPDDFGGNFVKAEHEGGEHGQGEDSKPAVTAEAGEQEEDDEPGDDLASAREGAEALLKSVLGSASDAGVTRNRKRTSLFFRRVWFGQGRGLKIARAISERAAAVLGLPADCAEAPQIVCYPGGATYFREHHDTGLLEWEDESGSGDSPRKAKVRVDRDEHGAARVATVFVYLSSHQGPEEGGATKFGHLNGCPDGGVRFPPKAGSAAVWSNVDSAGRPDVAMIHEAEELTTPALITIEEALKDESVPMKIGLNLWFTDRRDYPRPETAVGAGLVYASNDVH